MTAESSPLAVTPQPGRAALAWGRPALCAVALALLHFAWLAAHHAPATMSPDANGYIVQARLIATEGSTSFAASSPAQFVGMHWLETDRGVFHSRYPAGLPLLFAAAWKLGGLDAALWVNPLLASVTVLLVFLLARRFVRGWLALLAAAVVATVPVFNQHALDADAHIAAAFLLAAGILALLRFVETHAVFIGVLGGLLLGALPSVRYPEAIVGLPVGAWLLFRLRPAWRVWPAAAGAVIPLAALGAHNASAYGAIWKTGYALTGEQTGFGLGYFAAHAVPYLQALAGPGLGLMFGFGAAGLAGMTVRREHRAEAWLFTGIVVPLMLLYMAYYFGGGPGAGAAVAGNLRFLIPTFPFFAIGAAWLLALLVAQLGRAGWGAVTAVVVLQFAMMAGSAATTVGQAKATLAAAARARAVAEKEMPAGSVLIVDRQLAESLDAVGRWKLVEENVVAGAGGGPGGFGPMGRGGRGMRPDGAGGRDADAPSPQQAGKNRGQAERYAGLTASERRTRVWADLQQWAPGQRIFWFARSLDALDNALPSGAEYRNVAELEAPRMMGPAMLGGGPHGEGPGSGGPGRGGRPGGFGPPGMGGPFGGGPAGMPGGRAAWTGTAGSKLRVVEILFPSK